LKRLFVTMAPQGRLFLYGVIMKGKRIEDMGKEILEI